MVLNYKVSVFLVVALTMSVATGTYAGPAVISKSANELPSYVTIPLSKKFSNTEKLDKEIVFTKTSLDEFNKTNGNVLNLDKKGMIINSLISTDLKELGEAYKKANKLNLRVTSAYRSFSDQTKLRTRYGKIGRRAFSTPTGTSEHHLGTTLDFGLGGNRARYSWLDENSWKYGFVRSYGKDCSNLTGINPEEWHYRWIGKKNAEEFIKLKKIENAKGRVYCPLSYFRLKAGKWPE